MVRLMFGRSSGGAKKAGGTVSDNDDAAPGGSGGGRDPASLVAAPRRRRPVGDLQGSSSSDNHQLLHPMYQYAVNEYAQTVAAGTSNDAGGIWGIGDVDRDGEGGNGEGMPGAGSSSGSGSWTSIEGGYEELHDGPLYLIPPPPQRHRGRSEESGDADSLQAHPPSSPPPLDANATAGTFDDHGGPDDLPGPASSDASSMKNHGPSSQQHQQPQPQPNRYHKRHHYNYPSAPSPTPSSSLPPFHHAHLLHPVRSQFEAGMPDATYEEAYGDAYTGGPIRYVYPSGYQSMRPRSCPWKISILVCLLFTWMSIFIVGHCSDQVVTNDQYSYYANNNNGENAVVYDDDVAAAAAAAAADDVQHDDKEVVLQTRWCGSRPLYLLWVTSMLITGLAAAYCSVIGYIKVRDFAVGNVRSQPPGVVVTGKSDYYVQLGDDNLGKPGRDGGSYAGMRSRDEALARSGAALGGGSDAGVSNVTSTASSYYYYNYRPSIYQSDGTPQFWGSHIYRPTQAAVAVTSR